MHLAWMCKMYERQLAAGRLILHEHPANATSWSEPCILSVLQKTGVARITADQCQLGQQAENGEPVRKPTGFMSNCSEILERLHRRCTGRGGACSRPKRGKHQLCNGKTARRAAIFQRELCEAVLIGLCDHLRRVGRLHRNEQGYASDRCGIMIDGDDDVRDYVTFDADDSLQYDLGGKDGSEQVQAGKNDIGTMTNFGHRGSKLGSAC